ncbi:MAG: hypothetical protein H6660_09415 [Ardenticatenaceae bacterium]|nr:hypothetical protein [Ardenticatenaceae bacterium]
MTTTTTRPKRNKWSILALLLVLGILAVAGVWLLRRQLRVLYYQGRAILASDSVNNDGDFHNILFIHHSTGRGLIADGAVREQFTAAGYDFWDMDYNYLGLTNAQGERTGYTYFIPDDNTDPDGYAALFSQTLYEQPRNAFSGIMQHQVIIFKSCFPTSDIQDEAQLAAYQAYYRQIRDVIDQYPDHLFIVMTPPPLEASNTTPENAGRARAFANWLASDEFLAGHPNLATFDFFNLLAGDDPDAPDFNMLRTAYQHGGGDSHPNKEANETIGPLFAAFVLQTIESYRTFYPG